MGINVGMKNIKRKNDLEKHKAERVVEGELHKITCHDKEEKED